METNEETPVENGKVGPSSGMPSYVGSTEEAIAEDPEHFERIRSQLANAQKSLAEFTAKGCPHKKGRAYDCEECRPRLRTLLDTVSGLEFIQQRCYISPYAGTTQSEYRSWLEYLRAQRRNELYFIHEPELYPLRWYVDGDQWMQASDEMIKSAGDEEIAQNLEELGTNSRLKWNGSVGALACIVRDLFAKGWIEQDGGMQPQQIAAILQRAFVLQGNGGKEAAPRTVATALSAEDGGIATDTALYLKALPSVDGYRGRSK